MNWCWVRARGGSNNIQQHQQQGRSDHSNTAAVVRDGVLLSTTMSGRQLLIVTALCARFVCLLYLVLTLWTCFIFQSGPLQDPPKLDCQGPGIRSPAPWPHPQHQSSATTGGAETTADRQSLQTTPATCQGKGERNKSVSILICVAIFRSSLSLTNQEVSSRWKRVTTNNSSSQQQKNHLYLDHRSVNKAKST